MSTQGLRIFLAGATGTIGRATARAAVDAGHHVVCAVRRGADVSALPDGAEVRFCEAVDPASLARDGFRGEPFNAVVSCLASRTGIAADAWVVDHGANLALLNAARAAGIGRFVLLSAICVQKPELAFQEAKLAFEAELRGSGLVWTIVRPTAFFKSLSGQVSRVMAGRPFLVFGDGRMTACKPISDRDMGRFLVSCLDDVGAWNTVLPVGGPDPAVTPMDQAEALGRLLGRPVRVRHVPLAMMDGIVAMLGGLSWIVPRLAAKAELARIGRYYARESMLVLDPATGRYDADATPSFGQDRLFDYYADLVRGAAKVERGAHAVFPEG